MSTPANDGGPAFPIPTEYMGTDFPGMSLRDWFAGKAMQGMLAAGEGPWQPKNDTQLSAWAYQTADAMLEARKQKGTET